MYRRLHTCCHTLLSPDPPYLESFLASHPASSSAISLYMLSTSLPQLSDLISITQSALPNSIGSFSSQPLDSPPTLSIITFDNDKEDDGEEHGIQVFRSELSGRSPAEVGHWQRPSTIMKGLSEDSKGSQAGDVEGLRSEQGWAGLWKGQIGKSRINQLEDVK